MHNSELREIDERTSLAGQNKFEMMLFRLGPGQGGGGGKSELYGINVFKIRELLDMSKVQITSIANSPPHIMGVVNIRGQIIQVIDLPGAIGCKPDGLKILMVTEYARTTQAFALEGVEEIVRLEWGQVKAAEGVAGGGGTITSIAHLDSGIDGDHLVQVLDVEQILRTVSGAGEVRIDPGQVGDKVEIPAGTVVLAADDSHVARMMIEEGLRAMQLPYVMVNNGKEAWERLQEYGRAAEAEGRSIRDKVALLLTDLEMPEMDGFTLTKQVKADSRLKCLPVVIHSSLSGGANESHVKSVGADGYVAKFHPAEMANALRHALSVDMR